MALPVISAFARAFAGNAARSSVLNAGGEIASGIGRVARSLADSNLSAAMHSLELPIVRFAKYKSNLAGLNLKVEPSSAISSYHARRVSDNDLSWLLAWHGIDWDIANVSGNLTQKAWKAAIELSRPDMDVNFYYKQFLMEQGYNTGVGNALLQDRLTRDGITDDRALKVLNQTQPYDLQTALQLWRWRIIGDVELDNYLLALGYTRPEQRNRIRDLKVPFDTNLCLWLLDSGLMNPDDAISNIRAFGYFTEQQVTQVMSYSNTPTPAETVALFNRGILTRDQATQNLMKQGYRDPIEYNRLMEFAKSIPGSSDLITFAVREVWDPQVVQRWGYDEEFPLAFKYWMKKQGYDWQEDVVNDDGTVIPGVKWPLAYWRQHWQTMSPTQAYEAFHRLRANRIGRYTDEFPGIQPFDIAWLRDVLKIADYPQPTRNILAAINSRKLTRVDIRRMRFEGVIDSAEVYEQYRDFGYIDTDAKNLSKFVDLQNERTKFGPVRKKLNNCIMELYKVGVIDPDGAQFNLESNAVDPTVAKLQIQAADCEWNLGQLKEWIRIVKKEYLAGRYTFLEAQTALETAGILPNKVSWYMNMFKMALNPGRKQLSTAKILDWYKRGLINKPLALQWLQNLGWSLPNSLLYVAQGDQDILKLNTAIAAKNAAAIQAAIDKLKKDQKALTQELRVEMPISTIKKWVITGIEDESWFIDQMQKMGYADEVTALHIDDIEKTKADIAAKEAAKCPKQPCKPVCPPGECKKPPGPPHKLPGKTDVIKLYCEGLLSEDVATSMLVSSGIDKAIAHDFLLEAKLGKSCKRPDGITVASWFCDGTISEKDARIILANLGYTDIEIDDIINQNKLDPSCKIQVVK